MDDNKTIRLRNLRALIAEVGSQANLARMLGGNFTDRASFIGQIVGKKATRQVGDDFARQLEVATGKLQGWMDQDHSASNTTRPEADGVRVRWVREISWVEAGKGLNMDAVASESEARVLYTSASIGERAFALKVRGDTMVDTSGGRSYPDGCIIIVDPARDAKPGDRVIVKLPAIDEVTFKQLEVDGGRRYLKPLNSRYPLSLMPPDARIVGVVVQTQIDE